MLRKQNTSLESELGRQIMKVRELESTLQEFEETLVEMSEKAAQGNAAESSELVAAIKDKEDLQADLASVERSFTELHSRYERLRGVVDNHKANEDILKKALNTAKLSLSQREEQFQTLKRHAETQLEGANDRIEDMQRSAKADNAVLVLAVKRLQAEVSQVKATHEAEVNALVKKHEAEITALSSKLVAMTAEKGELTVICDELMDLSSLAN